MNETTPDLPNPVVEDFIRREFPTAEPRWIHPDPLPWCRPMNCFVNVERQIRSEGGRMVCGWVIWYCERLIVEGEFHCLWQAPDGTERDITPQLGKEARLLFVPDSSRTWEGTRVPNVIQPLGKTGNVMKDMAAEFLTMLGFEVTVKDNKPSARERAERRKGKR